MAQKNNQSGRARWLATVLGCACLTAGWVPYALHSIREQDPHYRAAIQIQNLEETLGPFELKAGAVFTVVVHKKRLVWPPQAQHRFDPDDDETATSFEVRDTQGQAVYSQKAEDEPQLAEVRREGRFAFSDSFYAGRIEGSAEKALWIRESSTPSAPDACSIHFVLGLFDGKLVPFSEPFCANIVYEIGSEKRFTGNVLRLAKDPAGGEVFEVRERQAWGNYTAIIPIRVDSLRAKLLPARICRRTIGPAQFDELCEFQVEATRDPKPADTFVRLFPEPYADRIPQHVVVRPTSKVEFVSTLALNLIEPDGRWKAPPQEGGPQPPQPWLQVIIDGHRGWVRDQEDLMALGLPPVG